MPFFLQSHDEIEPFAFPMSQEILSTLQDLLDDDEPSSLYILDCGSTRLNSRTGAPKSLLPTIEHQPSAFTSTAKQMVKRGIAELQRRFAEPTYVQMVAMNLDPRVRPGMYLIDEDGLDTLSLTAAQRELAMEYTRNEVKLVQVRFNPNFNPI